MGELVRAVTAVQPIVASWAARLGEHLRASVMPTLSPRALAWMVMAPVWPEFVIRQGFPGTGGELAKDGAALAAFERALEAGILESSEGEQPWSEGRSFWMQESWRALVIEQLLTDERVLQAGSAVEYLRHELHALGQHLSGIEQSSSTGFPPVLSQFVRLAASSSVSDALDYEVQRELAATPEQEIASPMAKRWVQMVALLVRVVGGELEVAIARARRRIELFERRRRDKRSLAHYTPRPKLERAFVDLISSSDEASWALHYVGAGGMGKTMLMRQITAVLAPAKGCVTSRIDFDFINPNYPSRAPGLLLMALAEELKLDEDDAVAKHLELLVARVTTAHKQLDSARRRGAAQGPDVTGAIAAAEEIFVEVLKTIQGRGVRVVLILDTCEELARVRPNGELPEAVVKTFELLIRLKKEVPSLCVVFSGRRPLASAGYGWSIEHSGLPRRPYLRRAAVTGFDEAEARAFLGSYHENGRGVPRGSWSRILQLCPVQSTPTAGAVHDSGPTVNPFDLDLYASWVASSSDEDSDAFLDKGIHTYVSDRIIGRAGERVKPWLPHLTRLKHFDRDVIAQLTGQRGESLEMLWQEIGDQEWVDVERGALWREAPGQNVEALQSWMLDPNIAARLESYYRDEQGRDEQGRDEQGIVLWRAAERRLRSFLPKLVLDRPWAELVPDYFLVAQQILKDSPRECYLWWVELETKIVRDRAWPWGLEVTERVLDSYGAALQQPLEVPDLVRAAVTATNAALRARIQLEDRTPSQAKYSVSATSLDAQWTGVLYALAARTDEPPFSLLAYRARAGHVSALRWRQEPLQEAEIDLLQECLDQVPDLHAVLSRVVEPSAAEAVFGTELGLVENAVELLERIPWRNFASPLPILRLLERIDRLFEYVVVPGERFQDAPAVLISSYEARLKRLVGGIKPETLNLVRIRAIEPGYEPPTLQHLDWPAPPSLATRLMIEWCRLYRHRVSPEDLERLARIADDTVRRLDAARPPTKALDLQSLDQDRLLSAICLIRADHEADGDVSDDLIRASLEVNASSHPQCRAHQEIPPLFQAALETRADRGRVGKVVEICEGIAQTSTLPLDVRQAAERVLLKIAARWRLREMGLASQTSLVHSTLLEDKVLLATAAAFDPLSPTYTGRWRASVDSRDLPEIVLAHCRLDLLEERDRPPDLNDAARVPAASLYPELDATARLRAFATGDIQLGDFPFGKRAQAQLALEEGSLLALRHPVWALQLLRLARSLFESCNDVIGGYFALATEALALCASGRQIDGQTREQLQVAYRRWEEACYRLDESRPVAESASAELRQALRPWSRRFQLVANVKLPADLSALENWIDSGINPSTDPSAPPSGAQGKSNGRRLPPDVRWANPGQTDPEPPVRTTASAGDSAAQVDAPSNKHSHTIWELLVVITTGFGVASGFVQVVSAYFPQWLLKGRYGLSPWSTSFGVLFLAAVPAITLLQHSTSLLRTDSPRSAGVKFWRALLVGLFACAAGFVICTTATVVLGASYGAMSWIAAHLGFSPGPLAIWSTIVLVVVVSALVPAVWRGFIQLVETLVWLRYVIMPLPLEGTDVSSRAFRYRSSVTSAVSVRRADWTSRVFDLAPNAFAESYFDRAKHEGSRTPEEIQATRDRSILRRLNILSNTELIVPAWCADEPWEAIVALTGTTREFSNTRFRFRRTSDPRDTRRPFWDLLLGGDEPFLRGVLMIHTELAGPDSAALRDCWWQLARRQQKHFALESGSEQGSSERLGPRGAVGILHVVDDVFQSERGLALRFGSSQLFPTEIVRRFPDLQLAIIQLPTRPDTRRFENDRRSAAFARSFAARLFDAGVPGVIVVPSLVSKFAVDALQPIFMAIARRPAHGTLTLMRAVRASQDKIAEQIDSEAKSDARTTRGPATDASLETPFDMCLYCRSNLNLRVLVRGD